LLLFGFELGRGLSKEDPLDDGGLGAAAVVEVEGPTHGLQLVAS